MQENREFMENNKVEISGIIASQLSYDHTMLGEKFYKTSVIVIRDSGVTDSIPIMVTDRMPEINEFYVGKKVRLYGQFRSYNKMVEEKARLILYMFPNKIVFPEDDVSNVNNICLRGFICKAPNYRQTPLGREVCDIRMAVNRAYKRTDYIPCIAWGRNARYASKLEVGTEIEICGRIQSRDYYKKLDDETSVCRRAYEVSIWKIEIVSKNSCMEEGALEALKKTL